MIGENETKLTDHDSKQLEGEITFTELSLAVQVVMDLLRSFLFLFFFGRI